MLRVVSCLVLDVCLRLFVCCLGVGVVGAAVVAGVVVAVAAAAAAAAAVVVVVVAVVVVVVVAVAVFVCLRVGCHFVVYCCLLYVVCWLVLVV